MNRPVGCLLLHGASLMPDGGSREFGCWGEACWELDAVLSAMVAACRAFPRLPAARALSAASSLFAHKGSGERAERCRLAAGSQENRLFAEKGISKRKGCFFITPNALEMAG